MSIGAIAWAYRQELPPGPKFVLVTLAQWVTPSNREASPSRDVLMKMTGVGRSQLDAHLKHIRDHVLESREVRVAGRISHRVYVFPEDVLPMPTSSGGPVVEDPTSSGGPVVAPVPAGRNPNTRALTKGKGKAKNSPPTPSHANAGQDEFERWWSGVWRKDGKGAARRAWTTACKKADTATLFAMRDAQRQKYDYDEQPMKFRKQPATWLNGECWLDESLVTAVEEADEYMGAEGLD